MKQQTYSNLSQSSLSSSPLPPFNSPTISPPSSEKSSLIGAPYGLDEPFIVRHPLLPKLCVLFVTCYFLLSTLLSDEMLAASTPFIKNTIDLDSLHIGLMYSSSFVPSLIFVIAGGFLHRKIGVRLFSLISTLSMLLGVVVFAMSGTFWGMILGRILFGIGLGPIEVINDIIALRWFANSNSIPNIQISFSIIASVGMAGNVLGFNLVPLLLDAFQSDDDMETLTLAMITLAIVPAIAVLVSILYSLLDWYASQYFPLDYNEEEESDMISTVKQLPITYWLLFLVALSSYSMMHVIMLYSVDYITEKWSFSTIEAGQISSSVYLVGLVVSPAIGFLIYKKGQVISILLSGLVFYGGGCILLGTTEIHPIAGFICIGLGIGFIETTLWTAVAEVVPAGSVGPAYAFFSAIGAIILVVVPFFAGWLHDTYDSYDPVAYLCAGGTIIGMLSTLALYYMEPTLQDPTDKYKQYYAVQVVLSKKRLGDPLRRHSMIFPDVKHIVNYLYETEQEDLLDHNVLFNEKEPVFLDLGSDSEAGQSRANLTRSLPPDFFSPRVKRTVKLTPIEESDPRFSEVETIDADFVDQPDAPDWTYIWKQNDTNTDYKDNNESVNRNANENSIN